MRASGLRRDDGLPRLEGSVFHLKQVLINLLTNAVKNTQHGSVTLSLEAFEHAVVKGLRKYYDP